MYTWRVSALAVLSLTIPVACTTPGPISAKLDPPEARTCGASWYGPGFHGNRMANGRRFNMNDPTVVAHKTLAFGTSVRLTNVANGRSIHAVVQDRGPYITGRCVDLSKAGAQKLGFLNAGKATVQIEIIR